MLEPHEVKARVVLEYAQALDLEEGPRDIDPSDDRVLILFNRGEYDLETTPFGAPPAEVAVAFVKAQQEVQEAAQDACLSVD